MIKFTVEGTPRPQGSKRHVGRGIMVESSKYLADWRSYAKLKAVQAMRGETLIEKPTPVVLVASFLFDRPKSHLRSNGLLKPDAPVYHTSKPDTEKLVRALLDACTGVCFQDDSQVCVQMTKKLYAKAACTEVMLMTVDEFREYVLPQNWI